MSSAQRHLRVAQRTVQQALRQEGQNMELMAGSNTRRLAQRISASKRRLEEEYDDLEAENRKLQEKIAEQEDLINWWADGCEAYRQSMEHLRQNWQAPPEEEEFKTDIKKLAGKKFEEVQTDPDWEKRKKEQIERRRSQKKKRKP